MGLSKCLETAGEKFESWLKDATQRPHPDIRFIVYNYGMQVKGSEENWEAVWKLFIGENDAQEKLKLMSALAAVRNDELLRR